MAVAYNPYQRYSGATPPVQGGGAAGEFQTSMRQQPAPASAFTGFQLPAGYGSAGAAPSTLLGGGQRQAAPFSAGPPGSAPIQGAVGTLPQQGGLWGGLGNRFPGGMPGQNNPDNLHPVWTPQSIGLNLIQALSSGDWSKMQGSMFGPESIEWVANLIRGQSMDDAGALQNRAALASQVYGGGDPSRAGYASLQGAMMGQSDTARLLGQGTLQQTQALQEFWRNLFSQMLSGAYGQVQTETGAAAGKKGALGGLSIGLPGISLGGGGGEE